MSNRTPVTEIRRAEEDFRSELDEIVRQGAQRMLRAALEAEVEDYVRRHRALNSSGSQHAIGPHTSP